jgi:hypothetical protein
MAVTCYCAVQLSDEAQGFMSGGLAGSIFDVIGVALNAIEITLAIAMAVAAMGARCGKRTSFMFLFATATGYVLLCAARVAFQSPIFYIRSVEEVSFQMLSAITSVVSRQITCAMFPAAAGLIALARARRSPRS